MHFSAQRKSKLPAIGEIYKESLKLGLAPIQLAEAHELLMDMPDTDEDNESEIEIQGPQASQCKAVIIAIVVICVVFLSIGISAFISLKTGMTNLISSKFI